MCMSCGGRKTSPVKTRSAVATKTAGSKRIVNNAYGSPKVRKSVSFSSRNR